MSLSKENFRNLKRLIVTHCANLISLEIESAMLGVLEINNNGKLLIVELNIPELIDLDFRATNIYKFLSGSSFPLLKMVKPSINEMKDKLVKSHETENYKLYFLDMQLQDHQYKKILESLEYKVDIDWTIKKILSTKTLASANVTLNINGDINKTSLINLLAKRGRLNLEKLNQMHTITFFEDKIKNHQWQNLIVPDVFPNIQYLNLSGCSFLNEFLRRGHTLQRLVINDCPKLKNMVLSAPKLQAVESKYNQELRLLALLDTPDLVYLDFTGSSQASIIIQKRISSLKIIQPRFVNNPTSQNDFNKFIYQRPPANLYVKNNYPFMNLEDVDLLTTTINFPQTSLKAHKLILLNNKMPPFLNSLTLQNIEKNTMKEGLISLSKYYPKTLQILNLGSNNIPDEVILEVALYFPSDLRELNLHSNYITEIGISKLVNRFPKSIKTLVLDKNNLKLAGLHILLDNLPSELTSLGLSDNNIEDGIFSEIKKASA